MMQLRASKCRFRMGQSFEARSDLESRPLNVDSRRRLHSFEYETHLLFERESKSKLGMVSLAASKRDEYTAGGG